MNAQARLTRIVRRLAVCAAAIAGPAPAHANSSVITVVGDFEDDSIAASIGEVAGVLRADCAARREALPARGQACLAIDIGATQAECSTVCDLLQRNPIRFDSIDDLDGFAWINTAPVKIAFRLRDADGRVFETPETLISQAGRWTSLASKLDASTLKRVRGTAELRWPVQVAGLRVTTTTKGRQSIYLDDIQVEHRVGPSETILGQFRFDEPTRIYSPGATVGAQVVLENRSIQQPLDVAVALQWLQPGGAVHKEQTATVKLPPCSHSLRSYQTLDFSQRIATPGLYRLVARARAAGWAAPAVFESTIAVTPTNRYATRGRTRLFGVRSNLLREPVADQLLELALARDLGAQLMLVEAEWSTLEPRDDDFRLDALVPLIEKLSEYTITPAVAISGIPEWLTVDAAARENQAAALISTLVRRLGGKLRIVQLPAEFAPDAPARLATAERLAKAVTGASGLQIVAPNLPWEENLDPALLGSKGASDSPVLSPVAFAEPPADVLPELARFREKHSQAWSAANWWLQPGIASPRAGSPADAVDVLRLCVQAAAMKVGTLVWFDLRDDDNDATRAADLIGLVRRDFSPKAAMIGYASAAGMLGGVTYSAPLFQCPPEFESALFVGSERQIGVVIPRPNRILPAVIAPRRGVDGTWEVAQFDREPMELLAPDPRALIAVRREPIYLTLKVATAQPKAQVAFATPWIRAPQIVFTDEPTEIQIDAANAIGTGFYRMQVPGGAPYKVSSQAGALKGAQGATISIPLNLGRVGAQDFERSELIAKISINNESLDLPLEVRTLAKIAHSAAGTLSAEHKIGDLAPPERQRTSASAELRAGFDDKTLHFQLRVQDDRVTQPPASGSVAGDALRFGIALEGADMHAEIEIADEGDAARIASLFGTAVADWLIQRSTENEKRVYTLKIPATSLGADKLEPGKRILVCATYRDDDGGGYPPVTIRFGDGLDGRRASDAFRWAKLIAP